MAVGKTEARVPEQQGFQREDATQPSAPIAGQNYTVRPKDTVWDIARQAFPSDFRGNEKLICRLIQEKNSRNVTAYPGAPDKLKILVGAQLEIPSGAELKEYLEQNGGWRVQHNPNPQSALDDQQAVQARIPLPAKKLSPAEASGAEMREALKKAEFEVANLPKPVRARFDEVLKGGRSPQTYEVAALKALEAVDEKIERLGSHADESVKKAAVDELNLFRDLYGERASVVHQALDLLQCRKRAADAPQTVLATAQIELPIKNIRALSSVGEAFAKDIQRGDSKAQEAALTQLHSFLSGIEPQGLLDLVYMSLNTKVYVDGSKALRLPLNDPRRTKLLEGLVETFKNPSAFEIKILSETLEEGKQRLAESSDPTDQATIRKAMEQLTAALKARGVEPSQGAAP